MNKRHRHHPLATRQSAGAHRYGHMSWPALIAAAGAVVLGLFGMVFLYTQYLSRVRTLSSNDILKVPVRIVGNKTLTQPFFTVATQAMQGKNVIRLTYDLHGLCLLGGKASTLSLGTNAEAPSVDLSDYGRNCYQGQQSIDIPLSDFSPAPATSPRSLQFSFWYPTTYEVDITNVIAYATPLSPNVLGVSSKAKIANAKRPRPTPKKTPTPTPTRGTTATPSPTPTPTPTPGSTHPTWAIQSVSSMKETKDRVCNPRPADSIATWVAKAIELGVNYISIETPYDNPSCGNAVTYTQTWVAAIRAAGLHVWHRHMPLAFEGIYGTTKSTAPDYIAQISAYIKANPGLFAQGDIFTPIPEPQNGGITGVNYCAGGICQFTSAAHFNRWLRDAMDASEQAFVSIGLGGKVKIGYYGFDGYITWGDNNPDWNGILEDATVAKMGNITIDHYPELVGDTMDNDLNELHAKYPNTPIVIGEWGTVTGGNIEQQVLQSMGASVRSQIVGFNYWHFGVGGNEALINSDFTPRPQFDEVQSFYKSTR